MLTPEAGGAAPRANRDIEIGLTPEAGRPAPFRTGRLRTWSRLVACTGTMVMTVVTTGRETVGQTRVTTGTFARKCDAVPSISGLLPRLVGLRPV